MISRLKEKVQNRKKVKIDQRLLIFLFFLALSTLFWFLNALNKEYATKISYPVEYANFPKNKVLVGEAPEDFILKVRAYGFSIIQHKLDPVRKPIIIDVSELSSTNEEVSDTSKYFLSTKQNLDRIADQVNSEFKVLEIEPDSIFFQYDDIVYKEVPVKPELDLQFADQFVQNGPVMIIPDSVEVAGPNLIIDTISAIYTKKQTYTGLKETVYDKIDLTEIKGIILSTEKVSISIPVERYTEATIKVPIYVRNLPQNSILKMFPDKVNISYLVTISQYEKISPDDFLAVVDFEDVNKNKAEKLKVQVVKAPENIISYRYHPRDVEYIIER